MENDFVLENHGSIYLLRAKTEAARDWAAEHLPDEAQTILGAVAIEPRYVDSIVDGIQNDGLSVE